MRPDFIRALCGTLLAAALIAPVPFAEVRAEEAPKALAPVYNPHTKSYFELRTDLPKPPQWRTAEAVARSKTFKGTRGRLAIVKDLETHTFLQANFTIHEEAWIGLRFYCSFRKLLWVTGDEHPLKSFKMWAKPWHRSKITCTTENIQYMPVHYLPQHKGFRWQASGPEKYFVSYFVEYPTGKE
jgi:hypothetical protein